MGGIGLSCNTTSTGYTHTQDTHNTHTICTQYAHNPAHTHAHTYIHRTQIQDTQMHNNTLANIYINTEYRTPQHNTHIPLCSTQKITQRTENSTQNRTQNTQNKTTQPQRTDTTQSCTHSFDFYHLQQYIKKLYNIAIYVFYIFCSPYL